MNRSGPVRREIASERRPVISATGTPSSAHAWNDAWSEAISSAGPDALAADVGDRGVDLAVAARNRKSK